MELREYFQENEGVGVLSTSDAQGNVNAAVYARPTIKQDGSVSFIMTESLSYHNVQSNPKASYLFKENSSWRGKRLYLTKIGEDDDAALIEPLRRRKYSEQTEKKIKPLHLVHFRVDRQLPLID